MSCLRVGAPSLALAAMLSACSYGQFLNVASSVASQAPPTLAGPTAVRTTLPVPPTPTPGPGDIGDPFEVISGGWSFAVDRDATLPLGPLNNPDVPTWELAPGQADKATLQGHTLHALKPGGILLEARAGDRTAYVFLAAFQPNAVSAFNFPEFPWWNGNLNGSRIINSNKDWAAFYESIPNPPVPGHWPSATAPAQSPPPIDFSQHSLLLYQAPSGPYDNGICVTGVTSGTVDMAIFGSFAEGERPSPKDPQLLLEDLIPKVPATATVNIERMPPEVLPAATPAPQAAEASS